MTKNDPAELRKLARKIQVANQKLHDGIVFEGGTHGEINLSSSPSTKNDSYSLQSMPFACEAEVTRKTWRDELLDLAKRNFRWEDRAELKSIRDELQQSMLDFSNMIGGWIGAGILPVREAFNSILDERCYVVSVYFPDKNSPKAVAHIAEIQQYAENCRREGKPVPPPPWFDQTLDDQVQFAIAAIYQPLIESLVSAIDNMDLDDTSLVPKELSRSIKGVPLKILQYLWPKGTVSTDRFWKEIWPESSERETPRRTCVRLNDDLRRKGFGDVSVDYNASTVSLNYGKFKA